MFVGGWDEMFPNDQPITFAGRDYPDHGELWTTPATWVVESDADHVTVTLEQHAECTNTLFQKRVTLRDGESKLRLDYSITNLGDTPLTYQWTLHPALPVTPNARLDLPARRAMLDPGLGGHYPERTFAWPHARHESGSIRDFRHLPEPDAGDVFQFWATDLEAGWAAITYPDEGIGFGFAFDPGGAAHGGGVRHLRRLARLLDAGDGTLDRSPAQRPGRHDRAATGSGPVDDDLARRHRLRGHRGRRPHHPRRRRQRLTGPGVPRKRQVVFSGAEIHKIGLSRKPLIWRAFRGVILCGFPAFPADRTSDSDVTQPEHTRHTSGASSGGKWAIMW